ncbi:hydroxypyruvate isomerase [Georgenia halophila]|uniref:Hydroxypyruvate isomerase n=1 Tax=Georgenia halophila TaxID=620889 RepID=A0ABP8LNP6_9MICO
MTSRDDDDAAARPRFAANLSMLYTDRPFLDRFAAAAADGFTGAEFVSPYEQPAAAVAAALREAGLTQVLFNLPAGDWAAGERGIACLPDRVAEFRDGVQRAIEYAHALGCSRLNCLAGIAPAGVSPAEAESTLVANLQHAAPLLADAGITLLVEAVNTRDVPGFAVPTIADAERLRQRVGSPDLALQYDLYHAQIMHGDLLPTYLRHAEHIQHIQIADHPGRHEPGTGEINYAFLLSALYAAGYTGWIGCEYVPTDPAGPSWLTEIIPTTETARLTETAH